MARRSDISSVFDTYMRSATAGRKSWWDAFPIETLAVSKDEVMLVDVGGGLGHETIDVATKKQALGITGKLILQDQAKVISQVSKDWLASSEVQPHNFFDAQPVKHAKAYYMRHVLHDWNDEACIKILARIRDAMKPGYSRLLIHDQILTEKGCSWTIAATDITMMGACAGKERTAKEFEALIGSVGQLKIEKIWPVDLERGLLEVVRLDGST